MKIIDASEPHFSKPMTENEVRDFLINSTKNIHISTLDEKENLIYTQLGTTLIIIMKRFT